MALRSTAQCRRKVLRRPPTPTSIWGTRATAWMLRQATRPSQLGYDASRRHLSSHRGPLKSHRRLGKRHMTGAIPSSGSGPAWYFEGPKTNDDWQWQAPTTVERRGLQQKEWNVSNLLNGLRTWLEASDADKPFLPPPLDIEDSTGAPFITAEGVVAVTVEPAPELYREILQLRKNICDLEQLDRQTLWRLCSQCYQSLQSRIELGDISTEELLMALDPFDSNTARQIAQPLLVDGLVIKLRRAILNAVQAAQERQADAFSDKTWTSLAARLCTIRGAESRTKLFSWVFGMMPPIFRDRISSEQIFRSMRPFVADLARRRTIPPALLAQSIRLGSMLGTLTKTQRDEVFASMGALLDQKKDIASTCERRQGLPFAWLMIRAFDPQATSQTFVEAYCNALREGSQPNSMQTWQLMMGRLIATGVIKLTAQRQELSNINYISMAQRWASLIAAVSESKEQRVGLRELTECLKGIGEYQTLAEVLTLPLSQDKGSVRRVVSFACGDHREAVTLHGTSRGKQDWTAWHAYIKDMVKDPRTEPGVWHALTKLKMSRGGDSLNSAASEIGAKMDLLDKMGLWYLEARHLSERQILRRIQKCASHQRSLDSRVSSYMLATIAEAVTRDLDKGEWGRTARLGWLVELTADTQDGKSARKVMEALRGWRSVIAQKGRGEGRERLRP